MTHLAASVVLGHQGGWDEILYLVVPVLLALGAVRFVEKRQRRRTGEPRGDPDGKEAGDGSAGDGGPGYIGHDPDGRPGGDHS